MNYKKRRSTTRELRVVDHLIGPSDRTWTCGLLTPSQARYQLRHTRKYMRSDFDRSKIITQHFSKINSKLAFFLTFSKLFRFTVKNFLFLPYSLTFQKPLKNCKKHFILYSFYSIIILYRYFRRCRLCLKKSENPNP